MIVFKQNQIFAYYELNPDGTYNYYNFETMTHQPAAEPVAIEIIFQAMSVSRGGDTGRYKLLLDVGGDIFTDTMQPPIQQLTDYIEKEGYHSFRVEHNPFQILFDGIRLPEIFSMIDDEGFQQLKKGVETFTFWRLWIN
jgi:hypothetical protein